VVFCSVDLFNNIFPNRLSHESKSLSCHLLGLHVKENVLSIVQYNSWSFSSCLRSCRYILYDICIIYIYIIMHIAALCIMICQSCATVILFYEKRCCISVVSLHALYYIVLYYAIIITWHGTIRCPNVRPRYQGRNITVLKFDSNLGNMKYPETHLPPFASYT